MFCMGELQKFIVIMRQPFVHDTADDTDEDSADDTGYPEDRKIPDDEAGV